MRRLSLLVMLLTAGCFRLPPTTTPMAFVADPLPAGKAKCLLVLLPGARDRAETFREEHFIEDIRASGLSVDVVAADATLAQRLVPGRPEVLGQVDWAVDEEMAASVADILVRRTQLYYRDRDQGLAAAPVIAERMAARLGWSDERKATEIAAYQAEVERSRRWRTEPPVA